MNNQTKAFLRYPGGKQRMLRQLLKYIDTDTFRNKRLVEPFVGGGAVFFALQPDRAILSDLNRELIDLYRGIRGYRRIVWSTYCSYPATRDGYYAIRNGDISAMHLKHRAARTLYLNRTCFKGMWRHNREGKFNVGYGGQDRRAVIDQTVIDDAARMLRKAILQCSDFESVIDACTEDDFIFCDPPYSPGEVEVLDAHYTARRFTFSDHMRLAGALHRASARNVCWAITTTAHQKVVDLFGPNEVIPFHQSSSRRPGVLTSKVGEVFISNYRRNSR